MKTFLKIISLTALLSITPLITAAPAQIGGEIHIRLGPPPPRQEVIVTRPYPEAVWIPGFHEWDPAGGVYVWRPGRWDRPPHRGARWIAPRYKKHGGEYIYKPGRWK